MPSLLLKHSIVTLVSGSGSLYLKLISWQTIFTRLYKWEEGIPPNQVKVVKIPDTQDEIEKERKEKYQSLVE